MFPNATVSSVTSAILGKYSGTTNFDGIGVEGEAKLVDYYGIGGQFTGGYMGAVGLVNNALNDDYYGLAGQVTASTSATGTYIGVYGTTSAESGLGLGGDFYATGDGASGTSIGVLGQTNVTANPVLALYTDVGMPGAYLTANTGRGAYAVNTGGATVGTNVIGVGMFGMSQPTVTADYSIGVVGQGESGLTSSTGAELYGVSTSGTYAIGLFANATGGLSNYAAYLDGDVSVAGNLSKTSGTFKIDHPQDPANKYLIHSFVESPDMMNIYNGNITTDANGFATVTMPSYFEALNMEFRYQLTPIGTFAQAIVATEVHGNQFTIQTDKPNVKVSWQVTGVRQDAWANAHRIVPEVDKIGIEKGKYIHPELFGLDRSASIGSMVSSAKGNLQTGTGTKPVIPHTLKKAK